MSRNRDGSDTGEFGKATERSNEGDGDGERIGSDRKRETGTVPTFTDTKGSVMKLGDSVWGESGRYKGAIMTYVGKDALGWHVCLNSNEPGGYVRLRNVSFYRDGTPTFDPKLHDPVLWNGYQARLHFVAGVTGIAS